MASPKSVKLLPDRPGMIDIGFVVLTGIVAIFGFRDTFVDSTFMLAGFVGLLLGAAVAHVANVLKQPLVVTAVFTVVAFFLLGGAIALHSDGMSALFPVPKTVAKLADQSVHGWKELLTTLPPVDSGPLLSLPYLMGLIASASGVALATRFRWPAAPILASMTLLSAVILLGVQTPGHVVRLGAVFAVLSIAWMILRARRLRQVTHFQKRRWRQRTLAAALCLGSASLAMVVGPSLPGVGDDRVVLRNEVTPPFNVGQYPSPLAAFRIYTTAVKDNLHTVELFTVTGVEPGALVRLATLDSYNGTVWGAANDAGTDAGVADTYQKVGSTIANPADGKAIRATVHIGPAYIKTFGPRVWLPTIGSLKTIDFLSPRLRAASDDFRYNLAASGGVVPGGLREGDSYSFSAVQPKIKAPNPTMGNAGQPIVTSAAATGFQPTATSWAGNAATPIRQVLAVANHLKSVGSYTNGDNGFEEYKAGHSVMRLKEFTNPKSEPAGDDEQYAATMALLANQLGVPSRVVLGAKLPEGGVVRGSDVHAWVELRAQDGTWEPLLTNAFMDTQRKPLSHKQKKPDLQPGIAVPPPVPVRPPSAVGDPVTDSTSRHAGDGRSWHFHIPGFVITIAKYVGVPATFLSAIFASIVFAKMQRRRRRRMRGTPTHKLASAYREVVDQARDLGHRIYAGQTRREQAESIGLGAVKSLAGSTDAQVFGDGDPSDIDAESFWRRADELRDTLKSDLNRRARFKAAINLASFRPPNRQETSS